MEAQITIEVSKSNEFLRDFKENQIPFVTAVSLTRAAQISRDYIRAGLSKYFTIRSPRIKKGVRMAPAKKEDFFSGNIHSAVFDVDPFMALHVQGGTKTPARHKYLSIPTDDLLDKGARGPTGAIKKQFKPGAFIEEIQKRKGKRRNIKGLAPQPFIISKGPQGGVIAQRLGKGQYPLVFWYSWHKDAQIKKGWPFVETVQERVTIHFEKVFANEMKKAVRS